MLAGSAHQPPTNLDSTIRKATDMCISFVARNQSEEKIIPYSGQLRFRMPKSLHAALASGAENDGVSLNTYIITLLSEGRIEKELMKKVKYIEKMLEVMNSREMSDSYDASQPIHKIEEGNKRYRSKKNKKDSFPK